MKEDRDLAQILEEMRAEASREGWSAIDQHLPEVLNSHLKSSAPDELSKERILARLLQENRLLHRAALNGHAGYGLARRSNLRRILWPVLAAAAALILLVAGLSKRQMAGGSRVTEPYIVRTAPTHQGESSPPPRSGEHSTSRPIARRSNRSRQQSKPPPGSGMVVINIGRFVSAAGDTRIWRRGSATPIDAKPGTDISCESRIETGDADKAEFAFDDGTRVALNYNTTLVVGSPSRGSHRPRDVRLLSGKLTASVVHSDAEGPFRVWTSPATAQVIGTKFSLEVRRSAVTTGAQQAVLRVQHGRVAFYNDHGKVTVGTADESVATPTAAPSEPQPLKVLKVFYRGFGKQPWTRLADDSNLDSAASRYVFPIAFSGLKVGDLIPLGRSDLPVVSVALDSPAQKAGLRVRDLVVAVDGKEVRTPEDVHRPLRLNPGAGHSIRIVRAGKLLELVIRPTPVHVPIVAEALAARLETATRPAILADPGKALPRLEQLAKDFPSAPSWNNLAAACQANGEISRAIGLYRRAVEEVPSEPLYRLNLALALRSIGNFERSLEELLALREIDRYGSAIQRSQAWSLLERQAEAISELEFARRNPRCSNALLADIALAHAEQLMVMKRSRTALQFAKEAVRRDPERAAAWELLGKVQEEGGDSVSAEQSLGKALELDPASAHIQTSYGRHLYHIGKAPEALAQFKNALALKPDEPDALDGAARALLLLGRTDEAKEEIEKLVKSAPDYADGHVLLARVSGGQAAEGEYESALELQPRLLEARTGLMALLGAQGRFPEADRLYDEGAKLADPDDLPYLLSRYASTLKQGHLDRALDLARRAVEMKPDGSNLEELGSVLRAHHDSGAAEEVYKRAIAAYGADHNAVYGWTRLLEMYLEQRRFQEAIAAGLKAVEIEPYSAYRLEMLGQAYDRAGQRDMAIATWKRSLELHPTARWVWESLANAYWFTGQVGSAKDAFGKAWTLDPKAGWNLMFYCRLCFQLGENVEAERAWRQALQLYPDDTEILNLIGWSLMDMNDHLDEALRMSLHGEELGSVDCAANVAWGYFKMGDLAKAKEQLEKVLIGTEFGKATAGTGGQPETWTLLGWVYDKLGRHEDAKMAFEKAGELRPRGGTYPGPGYFLQRFSFAPQDDDSVARAPLTAHSDDTTYLNSHAWALIVRGERLPEALQMSLYGEKLGSLDCALNAGWVYYKLGDLTAARVQLEKVLVATDYGRDNSQGQADSWALLGTVYQKLGQFDKALDAYRAAIALFSDFDFASRPEFAGGKWDAEEIYRQLLIATPDDLATLNNFAYWLALRGIHLDEALKMAARVVKVAPQYGGVMDTLGWVQYKRKEYADAVVTLKRAVELTELAKAKDPVVLYHLGMAYEGLGDKASAIQAYEASLAVNPGYEPAAQRLKTLKRP